MQALQRTGGRTYSQQWLYATELTALDSHLCLHGCEHSGNVGQVAQGHREGSPRQQQQVPGREALRITTRAKKGLTMTLRCNHQETYSAHHKTKICTYFVSSRHATTTVLLTTRACELLGSQE